MAYWIIDQNVLTKSFDAWMWGKIINEMFQLLFRVEIIFIILQHAVRIESMAMVMVNEAERGK